MTRRSYRGRTVPIHEGPMADTHGSKWREDAARLEALDQERIENPMQTLPNSLHTIDKAHAFHAKSDEGAVDKADNAVSGNHITN